MMLSAEVRLWWRAAAPAAVRAAFGNCAGDAETRVDRYLRDPANEDLGIKLRDAEGSASGVEVKSRIAVRGERLFGAPVELWVKQRSEVLRLDGLPLVETRKTRWLRRFAADAAGVHETEADAWRAAGCNAELARVALERGPEWWSLGLEAFGPLDQIQAVLAMTAIELEPSLDGLAPDFTGGYPAWLAQAED